MSDVEVELLAGPLRVLATVEPPPVSAAIDQRVDELWAEELRAHPERFDGTMLCFLGRDGDSLRGRFTRYRYYLAQRRDPEVANALRIVPLAVSGLVECAGAVAFATRSERVTQYPGWIELVPSGGIDLERLQADQTVDYLTQLAMELDEEAGVPATAIASTVPLALLRDRVDETVDIGCVIRLHPAARPGARGLAPGGEYRSLRWVAVDELPAFVIDHRAALVPTSVALVGAFLRRLVD